MMSMVVVRPRGSFDGDTDVITGAALTVRPGVSVATPPSGLVAVSVRSPTDAVGSTETMSVSCVGLTYVRDLTVTPVPLKDATVVGTNPLPVSVSVLHDAFCPRRLGESDVIVTGADE